MSLKRMKWICRHWKLIVHLLLKTNRFGVNNQWASNFDSIMGGWTNWQRIFAILMVKPVWKNYQYAKLRATACGFLTREECELMGWKSTL